MVNFSRKKKSMAYLWIQSAIQYPLELNYGDSTSQPIVLPSDHAVVFCFPTRVSAFYIDVGFYKTRKPNYLW
jgi:hypothetical protein